MAGRESRDPNVPADKTSSPIGGFGPKPAPGVLPPPNASIYRDPAVQEWCYATMLDAYRGRAFLAAGRARLNIDAQSRLILATVADVVAAIVESTEFRDASDRNTDVLNLQPVIYKRLAQSFSQVRTAKIRAFEARMNAPDDYLEIGEIECILRAVAYVFSSLMVAAGVRPVHDRLPTYGWREEFERLNQADQASREAFPDPVTEGDPPARPLWFSRDTDRNVYPSIDEIEAEEVADPHETDPKPPQPKRIRGQRDWNDQGDW